ncbi:hypothetical protein [Peribacillus sp. SCS-155]|uniref:hypothetical protein n=1 Tax=Peribacillus sedimenti TaxID=3115297 RepID=UPI0039062A66
MSAIIIFLLFILNLLTILGVIVLFLRQNRLLAAEQNQKKIMGEIEEVMNGFMLEMNEQNELLLERFSSLNGISKKTGANSEVHDAVKQTERASLHSLPDNQNPSTEEGTPDAASVTFHGISSPIKEQRRKAAEAYQTKNHGRNDEPIPALSSLSEEVADKVEISASPETTDSDGIMEQDKEENTPRSFKELLDHEVSSGHKPLPELALEMHDQGMSVEEIAKQLNKGKTEIELLLKFRT